MTKKNFIPIVFTITGLCLSCVKAPTTSSPPESDGQFRIYLAMDDLYGKTDVPVAGIMLSDSALISVSDIKSYNWETHTITLTTAAYSRLLAFDDLWRKAFVVTVGNERIYWGLFQTYADSFSGEMPVIILELKSSPIGYFLGREFVIQRSYHDREDLRDQTDPREEGRIYRSLKKYGLLR